MDKETLQAIMDAIGPTSIAECEIDAKGGRIRIIRQPNQAVFEKPGEPEILASEDLSQPEPDETQIDITSSWVGYFYRGLHKDDKPCVKLREVLKEGQVVGSVVTMNVVQKVFSPIAGKLIEILVEDGQPVEYGQPLLRLRTETQDIT